MQKISTHLWYDKEAKEAANFYVTTFGGESKIYDVSQLHNTPSGDVDVVNFNLLGFDFTAISAGPLFKFTPAISFIVGCETKEEVDRLWTELSKGGKTLIPVDAYPFSERYGWTQDKYGLSWQLMLTRPEGDARPRIVPSMLFVGEAYGKAEEAVNFYISIFSAKDADSKIGTLMHYGPGQEPNKEGTVMFSDFTLLGTWLSAMDGGGEHAYKFNEAVSIVVRCQSQEEIDYYWEKLSAVPESEQCGWLKDKFGVSWQVVPSAMDEMMKTTDKAKLDRVTKAFLQMKKFDIVELEKAANG